MEKEYSYYSGEEFVKSLSELSDLDMKKLMLYSERLCQRYELGCDGLDVFQESISRIIAGDRNVPKEIPVLVGVRGVITSVADSFLKSKLEYLRKQSISLDDDNDPQIEPAAVQVVISSLDEESLSQLKWLTVVDFFEGDDEVLQLIELLADGIKAADIEKRLFNGDKKKYNALYKRFMRKRTKLQQEVTSL